MRVKQTVTSTHGVRIKTFIGWSDTNLDKRVNNFLKATEMEFIDMKFSSTFFFYTAAVIYKVKEEQKADE